MEDRFRITGFDAPLTAGWVAQATDGRLTHGQAQQNFTGVTTDSRLVQRGDLFVALRGENSDGHQYLAAAVQAGAAGLLYTQQGQLPENVARNPQLAAIATDDSLYAFGELAHAWRNRLQIPMLGITGSNGKTTTKELCVQVLQQVGQVHATWKNWNNLLGVPLTLLGLRSHHTHAVIEMGMNAFGEIRRLAQIANPTHRLITNVMAVHLEGVGDIAGVARAKAELLEQIGPQQTFIVNADDPHVLEMSKRLSCRQVTYSRFPAAKTDIRIQEYIHHGKNGFTGKLLIAGRPYEFTFPLSGEHNLSNMLAAVATGYAMNIPGDMMTHALRQAQNAEMRSEWLHLDDGIELYNDCYNANPGSMRAALDTVTRCRAQRRIAVLGDMWELGDSAAAAHAEILKLAAGGGYDLIFCLGPLLRAAAKEVGGATWMRNYDTAESLAQELGAMARPGDLILVKGSRGMHMERVTQHLTNLFGRSSA